MWASKEAGRSALPARAGTREPGRKPGLEPRQGASGFCPNGHGARIRLRMGPGRHGRGTGATEAFPRMGSPRRRIARHPPDRRCGHALSTGLRRRQSPSSGGGRCPPTFPRMAGHGGAPSSRPAILRVPAGGSPPVMRSRMSLDISARRSGSLRPRRTFIGSAADPPPNLRTIRRGNLVPCRPGPRMRGMFVGLGRALVEYRPYRRRSSPVRRFPYPRRPGRNSAIRLRPRHPTRGLRALPPERLGIRPRKCGSYLPPPAFAGLAAFGPCCPRRHDRNASAGGSSHPDPTPKSDG